MTSIDSKHVANHIEGQIVSLARIIQVEKGCSVEDSIEYVRRFLLSKHREVMTDDQIKRIEDVRIGLESKLKAGTLSVNERETYKILREIGLI